jgi:hypothetical protein
MIVDNKRLSSRLGCKFTEYYWRTLTRRERLYREAGLFEKPADQLSGLVESEVLG